MLIVAFAGRLKFINSEAPPCLADCRASLEMRRCLMEAWSKDRKAGELAPHSLLCSSCVPGSWSYHSTNLARPSVLSSSHATLHGPLGGQMWPQDIRLLLTLLPQVSLASAHKREQDFWLNTRIPARTTMRCAPNVREDLWPQGTPPLTKRNISSSSWSQWNHLLPSCQGEHGSFLMGSGDVRSVPLFFEMNYMEA